MTLPVRSSVELIQSSQISDHVSQTIIGQYFQVAVVTLLVYDALITLDKEAAFFWVILLILSLSVQSYDTYWMIMKSIPKKPVEFVYYANRYVGILGAVAFLFWSSFTVTSKICNFALWTQDISYWITLVSVDYILMVRVLALYSRDKRLSKCLSALFALDAVAILVLIVSLNVLEHATAHDYGDLSFCGNDNIPPWQLGMVAWLTPLAYGTLLMILALYKAADYWRMSAGLKGFRLVKVVIEDQLQYFVLAIACSMFGVLEFRLKVSNVFLSYVLQQLGNPSFLSLLGSRMLFNLKEAGAKGENEGTSYRMESRTLTEIDFRGPANFQSECETETAVNGVRV